jgi:L-fuculose-phosphate aldolase
MSSNLPVKLGRKKTAGRWDAAGSRGTTWRTVETLNSKSPKADLEVFFNSPRCHALKLQICDIGARLWQRGYADGNGGNLAIRVGADLALCTPTLVSKGFMKPEDLCLVDFAGNQLLGAKKPTSEILMHLQIMQRQPRAAATVHCHPPYATGFAVAGILPPPGMLPEYELFTSVAIAPYRTPGTPELGRLVADLVDDHNVILMANHGVVAWSHLNVEDASFKIEILETYCRIALVASRLVRSPNTISRAQLQELLKIKQSLGIPAPRFSRKEFVLPDNRKWRRISSTAHHPGTKRAGRNPKAEEVIRALSRQLLDRFGV